MLCCHCKNNQATKTYEQVKRGVLETEYYCLDCFQRLFLTQTSKAAGALSVCPYCGTTVEEFQAKKLVGCAHCYTTLNAELTPVIVKMQGIEIHKGKRPPLDNPEMDSGEENSLELIMQARYNRQVRELTMIIEKLKKEKNYERAKEYADKLSRMRSTSAIEEDFVWSGNPKE